MRARKILIRYLKLRSISQSQQPSKVAQCQVTTLVWAPSWLGAPARALPAAVQWEAHGCSDRIAFPVCKLKVQSPGEDRGEWTGWAGPHHLLVTLYFKEYHLACYLEL